MEKIGEIYLALQFSRYISKQTNTLITILTPIVRILNTANNENKECRH